MKISPTLDGKVNMMMKNIFSQQLFLKEVPTWYYRRSLEREFGVMKVGRLLLVNYYLH